jgi:hypothetical protein
MSDRSIQLSRDVFELLREDLVVSTLLKLTCRGEKREELLSSTNSETDDEYLHHSLVRWCDDWVLMKLQVNQADILLRYDRNLFYALPLASFIEGSFTISNLAARYGRTDALKHLKSLGVYITLEHLRLAAEGGHLECAQWIRKVCNTEWTVYVSHSAAGSGNLALLQWCKEQGCPFDLYTLFSAARSGNLDVVRWVTTTIPIPLMQNLTREHIKQLLSTSIASGNLDLVKWCVSKGADLNLVDCSPAIWEEHLPLLKWLRSRNPPCAWGNSAFMAAILSGNLDILDWMYDNGYDFGGSDSLALCPPVQPDVVSWYNRRVLRRAE